MSRRDTKKRCTECENTYWSSECPFCALPGEADREVNRAKELADEAKKAKEAEELVRKSWENIRAELRSYDERANNQIATWSGLDSDTTSAMDSKETEQERIAGLVEENNLLKQRLAKQLAMVQWRGEVIADMKVKLQKADDGLEEANRLLADKWRIINELREELEVKEQKRRVAEGKWDKKG